jgi:hypothetical protein
MNEKEFNERFPASCENIVVAVLREDYPGANAEVERVNQHLALEHRKLVWKGGGWEVQRFELVNTLTGRTEDEWNTQVRPIP